MKFLKRLNPFYKYQQTIADLQQRNIRLTADNKRLKVQLDVQADQAEQMRQDALREIETLKHAGDQLQQLVELKDEQMKSQRLEALNQIGIETQKFTVMIEEKNAIIEQLTKDRDFTARINHLWFKTFVGFGRDDFITVTNPHYLKNINVGVNEDEAD